MALFLKALTKKRKNKAGYIFCKALVVISSVSRKLISGIPEVRIPLLLGRKIALCRINNFPFGGSTSRI